MLRPGDIDALLADMATRWQEGYARELARSLVPYEQRLWELLSLNRDSMFSRVEDLAKAGTTTSELAHDILWKVKRRIAVVHFAAAERLTATKTRRSDDLYRASRNYSGPYYP